jgi:hypothetical protein
MLFDDIAKKHIISHILKNEGKCLLSDDCKYCPDGIKSGCMDNYFSGEWTTKRKQTYHKQRLKDALSILIEEIIED